ncbi:hypothetical protein PTKIN_Ptkin04bG0219200 [Pterospermum kingtungense]
MDLRYIILVLLNLFTNSIEKDKHYSALKVDEEHLVLNLVFFFVAMLFVLLFLFTPIELPIHGGPITIRFGFFSVPVTILLVFSVTLTPLLFWLACLLIIPTSAWHGKFWRLLKRLLRRCSGTLQCIPPIFISIHSQRNSDPPAAAAAAAVTEVEVGEIDGSQMQINQQNAR